MSTLNIRHHISMKPFNTFGMDVKAASFICIEQLTELQLLHLQSNKMSRPFLILGGGSNILFSGDFEGTVIKICLKGIKVINQSHDFVLVRAGAGEDWDQFVEFCLNNKWFGLENLSLIPGTVGASPVQNIGAFGSEVGDWIENVTTFDLKTGETVEFQASKCAFGYRDSIFKHLESERYVIVSVDFKLSLLPKVNLSYATLSHSIECAGIQNPTPADIRSTVIEVRQSRLPEPEKIGNAGSFFKNPILSIEQFENLQKEYPEIPGYSEPDGRMKVAAAWLIEKAGWKGKNHGGAGVHEKQALVLVNYGSAKPDEMIELSNLVCQSVYQKFSISLHPEVRIV